MAFGLLKVSPSILIILLLIVVYVRNLVAIVDKTQSDLQGVLGAEGNGDPSHLEALSAALSGKSDSLNIVSNLLSSVPINFDPPNLDFHEQPIGIASTRVIRISNPTHSLTLQLTSISGNQPDFHSSFFVSKVLRPGESTTFEIVFLPRVIGGVEDVLLIQSSFGTYKYKVSGIGVPNMFRLRPLRGARIPINATYSPSISFYNPFESSLQIIELYSSGGSLHLELPHGISEGNKSVWEIRPYETKQIAKALFVGHYISNHTAFIRIKTNHISDPSIVLPVEVEVSEASGLFLSRELLDFGTIKSGGQAKLPLYVLNAGPYHVDVKSITPVPDNPSIKIEYTNTSLKPSNKYIKVAVLTFSLGEYPSITDINDSGIIKIWAEDKASFHQLTVPYEAHILQGTLEYEPEDTLFRAHDPPFSPILRNIRLLNQFASPIVIYSAKLSSKAQEMFSVDKFDAPYVLHPGSQWQQPIRLLFHPQSSDCLFNTTLRLATNASFFNIPLSCYDGSLECDFGNKDMNRLEFGLMSERDTSSKVFTITNRNPVRISITSLQIQENSNLPYVTVHLLSLPPQPRTHEIIADGGFKKGRLSYYLHSGQRMVFSVNVTRPKRPGKFSGEILMHTSFGKIVTVPVYYQAVSGGIQIIPCHIEFEPVFPHSQSSVRVHVKSTYTKSIKLLRMVVARRNSQQNSSLPLVLPLTPPTIDPSTTTAIGDIILDPLLHRTDLNSTNYLNDIFITQSGVLLDDDIEHFISLWEIFQEHSNNGNTIEFRLTIDTEIDRNITVNGTGYMYWPRLTDKMSSNLNFPVTLIGNTSELSFNIYNPSNQPLQVELLFLNDATDSQHILQTLSDRFYINNSTTYTNKVYTIITSNDQKHNRVTSYQKIPKFILPPHGNQSLGMEFSPESDIPANGLLLLRNNLTIIDYVEVKGTGSRGFITVGGIHPGGTSPLLFEYTQNMLESCMVVGTTECGVTITANHSFPKSFNIRNSGPVPVMVISSLGYEGRCSNNGFRITSSCGKPFAVYPNRTRRIDIICTPDYTLSKITSVLHLTTPTGPFMEFPIMATLPHHMLTICYKSLPHTELEYLVSYITVPLWVMALVIMIIATVFQANWHGRRLHSLVAHRAPSGKDVPIQATGGPLFDLSNIARRVTSSITMKMAELGQSIVKTPVVTPQPMEVLTVKPDYDHNKISCTPTDFESYQIVTESDKVNTKQAPPTYATPTSHPSPTKRSKTRRTVMKIEKSSIMATDNNSPVVELAPNLTLSMATTVDNRTDQLIRKQSEESLQDDPSDHDHNGSSSNSSEQLCLTPDIEESSMSSSKSTNDSSSSSKGHSFTKEPGTGQTVMVKDSYNDGNVECVNVPDTTVKQHQQNVNNMSNRTTRAKTKKQKAQLKREEKSKRRKREKESNKKPYQDPQYDKDSMSSSTNSLEDDQPLMEQTTPPDDTRPLSDLNNTDNINEEEDTTKDSNVEVPLSQPANISEEKNSEKDDSPSLGLPLTVDDVTLEEEELPEMETSCSTIEFKTPALSPSPDDLPDTKEGDSEISEDANANDDTVKHKTSSQPPSPDTKPRGTLSLPSTPGKATPIKPRPSKLELSTNEEDHLQLSPISSTETDGAGGEKSKSTRLAPHELASSLLKKIPRPPKQSTDHQDTTDVVQQTISDPATVVPVSVHQSNTSRRKSNEAVKTSNNDNRRQTPLSSDAMPFYPVFPTPHPTAAAIPMPPQQFLPNRAPPIPSYIPPPHVPFEYPMMRPPLYHMDEPSLHQYDRKQRKKSEQKYPVKPEGCYPDRPHPFQSNYDTPGDWMGPHTGHMIPPPGFTEEDPLAMSYPIAPHRRGYVPVPSYPEVHAPPMPRPSDETIFDPNQLTPDEIIYLKQLRRRKMIEKHIGAEGSFDPVPLRHSSDPYSLASLRDRDIDMASSRYPSYLPPIDMEGETLTNEMVMASIRNRDRHRDDSTQYGTGSILNRAPGPPGPFASDARTPPTLSSPEQPLLLGNEERSDGNRWRGGVINERERSISPSSSTNNSAWQSLWSMQTPLLSAFEEQRQLATTNSSTTPSFGSNSVISNTSTTADNNTTNNHFSTHNTYDLFEGSSRSIWSLNEDDDTFLWIRKTNENN